MLRSTDASTWADFHSWLGALKARRSRLRLSSRLPVSEFLFRGQGDAAWSLDTTLERWPSAPMKVAKYYDLIAEAKSQIESYTDRSWQIPDSAELDAWLHTQTAFGLFDLPAYDYMVYLRHHGFPSPLLDWSASPYVAAYFALRNPPPGTRRVAIYAYMEHAGGGKGSSMDAPAIRVRGPNVRSHRRHFLQQSQYTLCAVNRDGHWHFASHELALASDTDEQDLLERITLPVELRAEALAALDQFNLNAFSLFGTEDSLMETMANRLISPSNR